jgi:hypothetical protein
MRMNTGWRRGALVGSIAVMGAALVAGCGSASDGGAPEKVSHGEQATIALTLTPDPFPVPNAGTVVNLGITRLYISPDCVGKQIETVVAIATTDATKYYPKGSGTVDTYHTAWTNRGFLSSACATGDAYCQHQADLWSIPKAHGFKYMVKEISFSGWDKCIDPATGGSVSCQVGSPKGNQFFLQGIANWNMPYELQPWWAIAGQGAPYNSIDSNSHPPYGSDYRSADWDQLWNLTARDAAYPVLSVRKVCIEVYKPMATAEGGIGYVPLDFFSAADDYDPNGGDW